MLKRLTLVAALALALPSAALAQRASVDVAPTTLELTPGQSGLFFVTNHSARPIHVQVQGMDWQQKSGGDVLTPSDTLFVSPPMTEIAPGARQTIRLMASPKAAAETQYRLLVTEMPDTDSLEAGNVKVLLQFSVPVFVGKPVVRKTPDLTWEASSRNGHVSLAVRNNGTATAKCVNVAITRGGSRLPFEHGGVFYVLPGSTREFQLGQVDGDAPIRVSGHDQRSDRDFEAEVSLNP